MNFKQLEALIYVTRHGTFKQAAESLYFDSSGEEFITPESIQYRIKQLESDLGVALYRKRQGSSRVLLTREGQLFLREAMEVYQRMREWRGLFLESERGWLAFASTQAILIHRLTAPMREFQKSHPQVRLRVLNGPAQDMERLVGEGAIDFALSTRPPESSELEYILWKRSRMVLVAPRGHALAKRGEVSLREIADHPLILLESEIRGDRELVDEAFQRADIKRPNIVMETSNSEIIISYVAAGSGLAIIAETSLNDQPRDVVGIPISDSIGKTEVGLLVREGQYLSRRARAFLAILDPVFIDWLAERDERMGRESAPSEAGPSSTKPRKKK